MDTFIIQKYSSLLQGRDNLKGLPRGGGTGAALNTGTGSRSTALSSSTASKEATTKVVPSQSEALVQSVLSGVAQHTGLFNIPPPSSKGAEAMMGKDLDKGNQGEASGQVLPQRQLRAPVEVAPAVIQFGSGAGGQAR